MAAVCADAALEFFEFNEEYMDKKKKDISKKEHNKPSYK